MPLRDSGKVCYEDAEDASGGVSLDAADALAAEQSFLRALLG